MYGELQKGSDGGMNDIDLRHGDCLELMRDIPDGSIDMILCDLPYGTTQCKWDAVIPFESLWAQYTRIIKDNGAIALFGSEPFSTELRKSNLKIYKYDWYWRKPRGTGHLNAKKQPLRDIEVISVFYKKQCTYNPQFSHGEPYSAAKGGKIARVSDAGATTYGKFMNGMQFRNDNPGIRYPKQLQEFSVVERGTVHPTQKPVALLEYLVKTYTNEGETVLDNCMGSGSTGVACVNTGRRFIGMELDPEYFKIAEKRILEAVAQTHILIEGDPHENH
jgi:site-specific DNA-methyltransferase (adenine-specific)